MTKMIKKDTKSQVKKEECNCRCHKLYGLYHGCSECHYFNGKHFGDMTKSKSQVLKEKFEKSYYRQYGKHAEVIEDIKLAIFDEYDDHESCGFDIGCIVHSAPFIKKIRSIIEQALTQAYKKGEEDGIQWNRPEILEAKLTQQKSEMIKEVEKMKFRNTAELPSHGTFYNQALDDVIEQLKK